MDPKGDSMFNEMAAIPTGVTCRVPLCRQPVSGVAELNQLRGTFGLPVEMDLYGKDTRAYWYEQQGYDLPPEWKPADG